MNLGDGDVESWGGDGAGEGDGDVDGGMMVNHGDVDGVVLVLVQQVNEVNVKVMEM